MRTIQLSIVFLTVSLLNSISLQAQKKSKIGLRVGSNFSKVSGVSSKYKLGINADAFFLFDLSEKFKMQAELGYARQGFKNKSSNSSVKLHYINFAPAMGKFYLSDRFNVEAGPKLGYLLSSDGISKDNLKKLDIGATAGFSYLISDIFEITARYNLGLKNISKINGQKIKNRGFQIGLGIRF